MIAEHRIARLAAVRAQTGLSRTLVYQGMAAGWFPKNIKLTPDGRAVGWLQADVDAWIAGRAAQRSAA